MLENVFRRYRGWLIALAVVCVLVGGYTLAYFVVRGPEPLAILEIEDGFRAVGCGRLRRTHPLFTWVAALEVSLKHRTSPTWCYRLVLREYEILERCRVESDYRREMGFPPSGMGGVFCVPPGTDWENPYKAAHRACEEKFGPWPKGLPYPVKSE